MPPPAIALKAILGSTTNETAATLNSLYATHIATLLWTLMERNRIENRRDIVVGLALKPFTQGQDSTILSEETKETFREVIKMIVDSQSNM